jgi:ASPIC and UnbV/FG-GAP-like repeat
MTAAWHLGPIAGLDLWWLLVTSPEVLVFLFFMITDPRTIPESGRGRRAYAVSVGLLATLLIAPWTSEFSAKLAVLGALTIVCAARPPLLLLAERTRLGHVIGWSPVRVGGAAAAALAVVVAAGFVSAPASTAPTPVATGRMPVVSTTKTQGLAPIDQATARRIAADLVADLESGSSALRARDRAAAKRGATGDWLSELWGRMDRSKSGSIDVPLYEAERVGLRLEPGEGQGPPLVVATLHGTSQTVRYAAGDGSFMFRSAPRDVVRTFELVQSGSRYLVTGVRGGAAGRPTVAAVAAPFTLTDVAPSMGLDLHHGAFRFGVTGDEGAMMGGGLCWLDYDGDGWLDLYVVNSYADSDIGRYTAGGGLPQSRLFRNVHGRFVDVTGKTRTGLAVRGNGCVAADLDGNGAPDLVVTTAGYDAARDAYDAVLWNNGDGTFTEGAKAAGIDEPGWHTGAAVADVNGDGRLDVFVAGYTDPNHPLPGSQSGFPANHAAVRDLLYLNLGASGGYPRFREVGRTAGLEPHGLDHGLGATFTDVNGDGRPDLFVANDLDPNRLYVNLPAKNGLGFRLVEEGRELALDDSNAGMGVAAGDFSGDGRDDLFVTNSRGQLHAVYRSRAGEPFADARPDFVGSLGRTFTGWGVAWADLDNDGTPELAMANGAIPVTSLANDAEPVRVLSTDGGSVRPLAVGPIAPRNGRGLAAADFDNDGDLDLAVGSIGGAVQLLRNDGGSQAGHWLEVSLRHLVPGTVVTAVLPDGRRLVQAARAGSSYLSSEDPRLHFGLGKATRVDEIVVRYPDGRVTRLRDVDADRIIRAG